MKEELKLRLWDAILEKVIYTNMEILDNGIVFLAEEHLEDHHPIIMESIGVRDKFDKEIFEGDIVLCERSGDGYNYQELVVIEDKRRLPRTLYGSSLISREILGNIYENKDLLKDF